MADKKPLYKEFTKGLIKENPVLRLVLGTCPTLAVTTSVESAIGMGLSASFVLICSNIVISALRKPFAISKNQKCKYYDTSKSSSNSDLLDRLCFE